MRVEKEAALSIAFTLIHSHSRHILLVFLFQTLRMHHALGPLSYTAMSIRKPLLIPSTYGSLQAFHTSATQPQSSTSSSRCWTKAKPSTRYQQRCNHKGYATLSGTGRENAHEKHHDWPLPPKGQRCPTPYQIFALKKNQAYSKTRFYQLVKIYHPDKSDASDSSISQEMKSERYRLVVAANIILSDPVKRSAYDRIGAGWDGKADIAGKAGSGGSGPFQQNWRDPSDPVWQNATWEDWERWREAREDEAMGVKREKQSPLYMNNSYFIALIALFALMGSSANVHRAQENGQNFVEQRDIVHDRAAKELRKVKQDVQAMRGRDERIQWFLRNREATMGIATDDVETMRQEKADRLMPEREICRSEGVVDDES
jgi:curved DNA-binding protein CbpA